MAQYGKTSLVINFESKLLGLQPYLYRKRNCDTNLNSNTPSKQYQKLKLIQNTVRVDASLYTANLGPLNAYAPPNNSTYGVCWNQMSDRPMPSVQKSTIPTGFRNSLNTRHHSVTSSRPGCQTPGGVGCDIKHNSYDRYLNRLKGKGPLRKGVVPKNFGNHIQFNNAYPIYGGKTTKTSIVSSCDCPVKPDPNFIEDSLLYNEPLVSYPNSNVNFTVGMYVYAIQNGENYYKEAIIKTINPNRFYTIEFSNGILQNVSINELQINYH
jgi:hypothetical protein